MKQNHSGHRKRLRDKIQNHGFESLYPHEFLEYILFACIPRKNTNGIARDLIKRFGGYNEVFSQTSESLMQVDGVGEVAAMHLLSYAQHGNRVFGDFQSAKFKSLGDAREFFQGYFYNMKDEELHILLIDEEGNPIAHEVFADKDGNKATMSGAVAAKMFLEYTPHFVLITHNHPSGNAMPSAQDIDFTKRIFASIKYAFNITNCEHMIFAGTSCYSFRQNGMLKNWEGREEL